MMIVRYFIIGLTSLPKIILSIFLHFVIGFYTIITIFPKYFVIGLKYIFGKKHEKEEIKFKIKNINYKKTALLLGLSSTVYLVCVFLFSRWSVQQLKIKYLAETIISDTNVVIKEEVIVPDDNSNLPNGDDSDDGNGGDNIVDNNINSDNNTSTNTNYTYYPNDYWDYINVPFINVDFDELLEKNADTVGWIKINNTKVNYPVVQTTDNVYYLSHAFNKTSNASGWVYADFRADFVNFGKNTIIYAHNLTNRTMFGSLVETQKPYWYTNKDNMYIKISTPTSNTVWVIFSTYTVAPVTDYLRTNFVNNSFTDFLETITSRSIYDFNIDVGEDDKILTLSTCNDTGTKRIVVHAKMVTINYRQMLYI